MNNKNIFEYAVRNKVRFPYKGSISVEDLWDLPVEELDKIYKVLNSQVKQSQEESLLLTKSVTDELLDTQIEIVKYVVTVKLQEQAARAKAADKAAEKQKILAIIARKQNESLENSSIEDLNKMLAALED